MEETDEKAVLDKDGGLRVPVHLPTFLSVQFSLIQTGSNDISLYYRQLFMILYKQLVRRSITIPNDINGILMIGKNIQNGRK